MSSTYDSAKTLGVRRHPLNKDKALTFLRIMDRIGLGSGYIGEGIESPKMLWIKGINEY